MRDSENDPQYRELLRRIAAVDIPDYPNWKFGAKCGVIAGVVTGFFILLFLLVCSSLKTTFTYGWIAIAFAGLAFLFAGAVGAFRPPRR
ncbi:hypothetical protein SDC9_141572 [bioreactor metagenome]|uniref:Uncharacterized protein n=1 Tax=bioreactor metagenome TaxID=1076179 RepID=A0A645DYK9_9ZZZZ